MQNIRSFNGKTPQIGKDVWVDPSAVVIGEVRIGAGSSVWPQVAIRGDIHAIAVGERSSIQDGSVLHVTHASHFNPEGHPLVVGDDVTVGHKVTLHGCEIGHHCLIGMGAIVLDGAVVEPYAILGAGSLVPGGKRLGSGLWMGSPARRVRDLKEQELEFLDYSAQSYARLGKAYLDEVV